MRNVEVRYIRLKSARSLRVWLVNGFICDTPAAGVMIGAMLFGWTVAIYPWLPKTIKCKTFL